MNKINEFIKIIHNSGNVIIFINLKYYNLQNPIQRIVRIAMFSNFF